MSYYYLLCAEKIGEFIMSGLNHQFTVLRVDEIDIKYSALTQKIEKIDIHDDFLRYIGDSLAWVPSINPSRNESFHGLCWYGLTVIKFEDILVFKNIILSWYELFSNAPEVICLTGGYIGESLEDGHYEKLKYKKIELLAKLKKLCHLCDVINESNGCKCMFHWGI